MHNIKSCNLQIYLFAIWMLYCIYLHLVEYLHFLPVMYIPCGKSTIVFVLQMLVYEFMPNGTLRDHLSGQ